MPTNTAVSVPRFPVAIVIVSCRRRTARDTSPGPLCPELYVNRALEAEHQTLHREATTFAPRCGSGGSGSCKMSRAENSSPNGYGMAFLLCTHGQTDGRTDSQPGRQTDGQTDRQADRPTDRQTDRQTNRQAGFAHACMYACMLRTYKESKLPVQTSENSGADTWHGQSSWTGAWGL